MRFLRIKEMNPKKFIEWGDQFYPINLTIAEMMFLDWEREENKNCRYAIHIETFIAYAEGKVSPEKVRNLKMRDTYKEGGFMIRRVSEHLVSVRIE